MADEWFSMATLDHFWIKRRYGVLLKLMKDLIGNAGRYADVGCGHGLLQGALARDYGCMVDGCDLNMEALSQNRSGQRRFHYNILEGRSEFSEKYEGVFALDVIEHIADDATFVGALLAMVKPGGFVCINVPALMAFYSDYDRRAGHHRRYSMADIQRISTKVGASIQAWSYWGMPLIPLAVARKQVLKLVPEERVIKTGFEPPGKLGNLFLRIVSSLELVPNHAVGTSLMAVLVRR